jgi:hypothetical protein
MPAKTAFKAKGRATTHPFLMLDQRMLEHVNFTRLSGNAVKLLIDIASQYRGVNNGDLSTSWRLMSARGWKRKRTLELAKQELIHYGWLQETRQGGRRLCSLYAITWAKIDYCNGKLDCHSTQIAPGTWKQPREPWIKPRRGRGKIVSVSDHALHCVRPCLPMKLRTCPESRIPSPTFYPTMPTPS